MSDIPVQLRRRRAASERMVPLKDGRRDPLDPAPRRRRWRCEVVEDGTIVLVRGWRTGELMREAGLRPLWHGSSRAWAVDLRHAGDVIALLEYDGARVDAQVSPAAITPRPPAPTPEPDLFAGLPGEGWSA